MAQKKHTPEDIIGKLREAEIVQAQGGTVAIFAVAIILFALASIVRTLRQIRDELRRRP